MPLPSPFGVRRIMQGRTKVCGFLVLQILVSLAAAVESSLLAPFQHDNEESLAHIPQYPDAALNPKQGLLGGMEAAEFRIDEEAAVGGVMRGVGSRPPSCERRCGACSPCCAIQIPTTHHHPRTQYTNYEPEGWKCRCGTSLFNP